MDTDENKEQLLDLIVYITSSGPNTEDKRYWGNLFECLTSLCDSLKDVNYKFYIVVNNDEYKQFVESLFNHKQYRAFINQESLLEVVNSTKTWTECYIDFFEKHNEKAEYLLISHDDILIRHRGFLQETLKLLEDKEEPVAWITFTNVKHYLYPENRNSISNSVKNPFAKDRLNHPCLYECHKFEKGQRVKVESDQYNKLMSFSVNKSYDKHLVWTKEANLDFPSNPVKVFGPYSHLNLISFDAARTIGPPSNWSEYTIFMDDDWSMAALTKNYNNVWIPNVHYVHPNPRYTSLRKPGTDLRYVQETATKFEQKWGFNPDGELTDDNLKSMMLKYSDTHVFSVMNKNTYDWDYLK
jgi:hypothetical protein